MPHYFLRGTSYQIFFDFPNLIRQNIEEDPNRFWTIDCCGTDQAVLDSILNFVPHSYLLGKLWFTLTEDNVYVASREPKVCPTLGEKCHNIVGLPFDPRPLISVANEIRGILGRPDNFNLFGIAYYIHGRRANRPLEEGHSSRIVSFVESAPNIYNKFLL